MILRVFNHKLDMDGFMENISFFHFFYKVTSLSIVNSMMVFEKSPIYEDGFLSMIANYKIPSEYTRRDYDDLSYEGVKYLVKHLHCIADEYQHFLEQSAHDGTCEAQRHTITVALKNIKSIIEEIFNTIE